MNRMIVMAAGCLLAAAGHAQTLGAALEQAWSRHPQAATLGAREAEAQARADVAAGLTPTPPSMSLSNSGDRFNADGGKDSWELELALPLWLPGQRAARALESSSAASEVAARRAALRLQLAGELREVWWQLAAARQAQDLAAQRETAARVLEADVLRRVKVGELARVDANLAQSERLAAEGERLDAQAALRQAEQTYRALTGADAPLSLAGEAESTGADTGALHPQSAAAQAAAQLAQARLNVAQQTGREAPELAVWLGRSRGDYSAPYAKSVGIKLTLPFSSGARVRQETAAAQADALQAEAEAALTLQRLALESVRAQRDRDAAQGQFTRAQERLALTDDTLHLTEKAFALGESDLASVLRARRAAFEAQADLHRRRTAQAASRSRLNQSMGVMP